LGSIRVICSELFSDIIQVFKILYYFDFNLFMKLPEEVKLALVTAACLIVNDIVFKNVLQIQPGFIILYSPFWVYLVYMITRTSKTKYDDIIYWGLAIGIVSVLTILLYSF
jgi:hypothetical protein